MMPHRKGRGEERREEEGRRGEGGERRGEGRRARKANDASPISGDDGGRGKRCE